MIAYGIWCASYMHLQKFQIIEEQTNEFRKASIEIHIVEPLFAEHPNCGMTRIAEHQKCLLYNVRSFTLIHRFKKNYFYFLFISLIFINIISIFFKLLPSTCATTKNIFVFVLFMQIFILNFNIINFWKQTDGGIFYSVRFYLLNYFKIFFIALFFFGNTSKEYSANKIKKQVRT